MNVVNFAFLTHYGGMATRSSYHHGNLANALTDAATEQARAGGPDAVVLRAAARAVGVSAAAAYRHFADHGELLDSVKRRALDALAEAMRASLDRGPRLSDPAQEAIRRFRALGSAYLEFALTDPGLFRTAFSRPGGPVADLPGRMHAEQGPYAILSGVLDELEASGVVEASRRPGLEIAAWAVVHGLATLLLDGPLAGLDKAERAAAMASVAEFAQFGIAGRLTSGGLATTTG